MKKVIVSVLFKDFNVFIWLGPITMDTVHNVTIVMLYTYDLSLNYFDAYISCYFDQEIHLI